MRHREFAGPNRSTPVSQTIRIEAATAGDVPVILQMINTPAEYEELAADVTTTEQMLWETLFTKRAAEVLLA